MTEHDIELSVNGTEHELTVESRTLLVHTLRDELGYTGTNIGCESSTCGACTVHLDGDAVKSCTMLAVQADGAEVGTVEGLNEDGTYHPIQEGFQKEHGLQCGYCTPGMMLAANDLLERNPDPDEGEIRHAIEGNLCRCTGYQNIVNAVEYAADEMGESTAPGPEAATDGGAERTGTDGGERSEASRTSADVPSAGSEREPSETEGGEREPSETDGGKRTEGD